LHADPRFRELVALVDVDRMTRTEGWRYDIHLLVRELKRRHYVLCRQPAPAGFDALARQLHDEAPRLTDHQLEVGLMKLARLAGDAHTDIAPSYLQREHRKAIGVQFYLFEEGLFVTNAAPAHKDLVGARVLRLGGHSVAEVQAALDPVISRDNDMWVRLVGPGLMRYPQVLNGLGLIPRDDELALTLCGDDGKERRVTLKADAGEPGGDWVSARDQTPGPEPLYLKDRKAPYWFEHLPDARLLYFQYNAVRNDPKEPLDKLCERLFAFIGKHDIDKLVIDMRHNGGGNNFLNRPLVEGLMRCDKVNRRGKLFVIVGRNTFSAAQCGATQIERHTNALFVGEPTGSRPNFVGETGLLRLPYSKMLASISDLYWQNSVAMDYRTWIGPQIYTPPTFAAYRAKKDPALEAILAYGVPKAADAAAGPAAQPESRAPRRPRPVTAQEALGYLRQRDWARAASAYEQLLRTNSQDGQLWYSYNFALHSLKRYDDAIRAATRAAELGYRPAPALYNIACAHALLGHKDEALAALEKALNAGFSQDETLRRDTDIDSLRSDPRFRELVGAPPEGLSRPERWRHDLDYLQRRMEKVHYSLYAKVSREKFQHAIDDLKTRVGALSDEEMAVGIQAILALVGDGHTTIDWRARHSPGAAPQPRYPLELYLFKEGLHVRGAAPELAGIVGARVLRVGNVSADEAVQAVAPLCSRDNAMGVKLQAPDYLTNPAVLSYLKIADDRAHVSVVVKKTTGEEVTVDLKPAAFSSHGAGNFVFANAGAEAPKPLSFRNNEDRFWFEYLPDRKLIYFQYNQVADKAGETLEKFCGRLFTFISNNPVEHLVIDMRNNSGGNNILNQALVHGLIRCDKVNRAGHLFVLVGRRTFSAAMNGAADLERHTHAVFVGEPTGSSPNHVGETNILVLPCSGVRLSCSSLYFQSSTPTDRRTWIAPALVAEPSIMAFANNRDPGLEAIFAVIEENGGP
jgi:tetratricopeptide (TPR) repeat protein